MKALAVLLGVGGILFAVWLFMSETEEANRLAGGADSPATSAVPKVEASPSWTYETVDRDAGAKKEHVGCIQSDDQISLKSPYEDTFARLCFRSDGGVWMSISSGQLLTGETHGVRVRFGDSAPRSFSLEQPSDYSSDAGFIVPSGPVFAAARAGKKMAVEATYYEAGMQTVTFSPNAPLVLK